MQFLCLFFVIYFKIKQTKHYGNTVRSSNNEICSKKIQQTLTKVYCNRIVQTTICCKKNTEKIHFNGTVLQLSCPQKDLLLGSLKKKKETHTSNITVPFAECDLIIVENKRNMCFFFWKHKIFYPFSAKLVERDVFDKRTQKSYEKIRFNTLTLQCFNEYREMFYLGKKKRLFP